MADVLTEYGVDASKVRVVHSSIDLGRLDVDPLEREALGVPEGVPLVGSIGALVGHKDHGNLVSALAIALKDVPDLHLAIAGEGALRPAIEARIAELGVGDRVRLLGHRDDAPRVLRALDVYVSSSWSEGLGTSVLEGLACGVPVVATLAGGAAEMVLDGETGLLIPARDPEALAGGIVRMLCDKALAQTVVANAKAHVLAHFTVDKMVEGNIAVYEGLLEDRASPVVVS